MNGYNLLKVAISLALAGFVLFGQSINDPFHFDDILITKDSNIANPAAWPHFFNPLHLRQLTFFTFYLNHLVTADNPTGYHLVNVLLHIANAILFFTVLRRWLDPRLALISAAIFLAHPIQTEPVMYVYQRSLLLACFFSLLALLALEKKRRWLAVVLFIAAFESKESALVFPVVVAIFTWTWRREPLSNGVEQGASRPAPAVSLGNRLAAALLLLGVALMTSALAILFYRGESTVGVGVMEKVSPVSYFLTQFRVIYTYLRLLVFPFPQSLEYDFAFITSFGMRQVAQIAGVVAILGGGFYLTRKVRWRVTGYSVITFFVLLAPTSSIVPSADAAFEHRLYLPMLAFSLFAASLIVNIRRSGLIAAVVFAALCVVTIRRGAVWGSDTRLWEDTVRQVPNKARAWFNLGGAYLESDPERAQQALKRTVLLRPDFAEAYYDLGIIEQSGKNYPAAAGYYEKTIELNSEYWPAWNNLGNTLLLLGERERALAAFETTLRLNPDHWPSQYNIAVVYFNSGRFDQAIPRLRTVLDWRPDFKDARYLLAVALTRTGQKAEAEREWRKIGNNGGQPPMPATIPGPTR